MLARRAAEWRRLTFESRGLGCLGTPILGEELAPPRRSEGYKAMSPVLLKSNEMPTYRWPVERV